MTGFVSKRGMRKGCAFSGGSAETALTPTGLGATEVAVEVVAAGAAVDVVTGETAGDAVGVEDAGTDAGVAVAYGVAGGGEATGADDVCACAVANVKKKARAAASGPFLMTISP